LGDSDPLLRFQYAARLGDFEEKTIGGAFVDNSYQVVELHGGLVGENRYVHFEAQTCQSVDVPVGDGLLRDEDVIFRLS
jgi:hypothetical protein